MKVNFKQTSIEIPAPKAVPGKAYKFDNELLLCFKPCKIHSNSLDKDKCFAHFVRMDEKDPSSIILNETDFVILVGEPTITIDN
jgi:hypothetical protein